MALFSFVPTNRVRHDFHTSLTEMRLNTQTKSLETTIRVFTDDLRNALKQSSGKEVKLTDSGVDKLLKTYVMKHFAFVKEEQVIFGEYVGIEVESDVSWIYLEFKQVEDIHGMNLLNSLFFDLFEDQSNVVNIIYPEKRKTLLFTQKKKLFEYPF